jgi:hypothetical protein
MLIIKNVEIFKGTLLVTYKLIDTEHGETVKDSSK